MKRGSFILLALLSFSPVLSNAQPLVDGIYTGWKKMEHYGEKTEAWFHINRLSITGEKVRIDTTPVVIRNNQLFYSASDGAFYTYKGRIYFKDKAPWIKLQIVSTDYGGVPKNGWPIQNLPIVIRDRVTFVIDGVTYALQERNPEKKPPAK